MFETLPIALLEQDDQQDDQQNQSADTDIHERSPLAPLLPVTTIGPIDRFPDQRRRAGKSGHLCWTSEVRVGVGSPLRPWMTHMLRSTAGT